MSFIANPGLVSYSNTLVTTVPNNGVPVAAFIALGPYAAIDAVLQPKGLGAVIAQVPDNTNVGGNKRGQQAVDWQQSRTAPTMVASAQWSTIGGGQNNTASGAQSTVAGGAGNTAVSSGCTVGGGGNNQAGLTAGAEQLATVSGGSDNYAEGDYATIPGGQGAYTRGVKGLQAYANYGGGVKAGGGRFQATKWLGDLLTTGAVPTVVCRVGSLGAAPDTTNVYRLANNMTVMVTGSVVCRNTATGNSAAWTFSVAARRGANAAATAVLAAATVTNVATDAGIAGVAIAVAANVTRGSIEVTCTGLAATNINWSVRMDCNEVAN